MRIHQRDLNVGDTFYECSQLGNLKMTVLTKPIHIADQWRWKATAENGVEVDYLITDGFEHYGPSIYDRPIYVMREELINDRSPD